MPRLSRLPQCFRFKVTHNLAQHLSTFLHIPPDPHKPVTTPENTMSFPSDLTFRSCHS